MKKTIITALIALLIMLAVTACDSIITEPETNKAEYTADGRKLVTVKVNISETASSSRSLFENDDARNAANYVEVIFRENTETDPNELPKYKYYHAEGYRLFPPTIKLPLGYKFEKADTLILLGRNTDKTLLGTGQITPSDITIATNTTSVSFTAKLLTAKLSAEDSSPSFVIDENTIANTAFQQGNTKNGSFGGGLPCFQVPTKDNDGIDATLTISGLDATKASIKYVQSSQITKTDSPPEQVDIQRVDPNVGADLAKPTEISFTPTTGVIKFSFKTKTNEGVYLIYFNIPVVGFLTIDDIAPAKTFSTSQLWFIRGGSTPGPDISGTTNKGVVLSVTNSPNDGGEGRVPVTPGISW